MTVIADTHTELFGFRSRKRADIDIDTVERDHFFSFIAFEHVRGFVTGDAFDHSVFGFDFDVLIYEHAVVVVSDRCDQKLTVVVDIAHDKTDFIHVRGQCNLFVAAPRVLRKDNIAERIFFAAVVKTFEFFFYLRSNRFFFARNAEGIVERA